MYVWGAYAGETGGRALNIWKRSLPTGTWTQLTTPSLAGVTFTQGKLCTYNAADSMLYYSCQLDHQHKTLMSIDPTNTGAGWTERNSDDWWSGYYFDEDQTMAFHASQELILTIGGGAGTRIWDASTASSNDYGYTYNSSWTGTDAATFKAAQCPGLDYDTAQGKLIGWLGGANVYEIDPTALTVTTVTPHGSNTVTPAGKYTHSGMWKYVQDWGVFVGLPNDENEGFYVYKP
jgi:hypothetical protein